MQNLSLARCRRLHLALEISEKNLQPQRCALKDGGMFLSIFHDMNMIQVVHKISKCSMSNIILGLFKVIWLIFPMENPPWLGNRWSEYFLFFGHPLSKSK